MNTFDIIGPDPLELNGKPATIQTIIDALWADDFQEHEPMDGAPEVCLCELCQSLVPALEQVGRWCEKIDLEAGAIIDNENSHVSMYYKAMRENAALRERIGALENELRTIVQQVRWYERTEGIDTDKAIELLGNTAAIVGGR